MRRVGRYIFNAATVVSLVMCVGTMALWVRGRQGRAIDYVGGSHLFERSAKDFSGSVSAGDGVLVVQFGLTNFLSPIPPRFFPESGWKAMFPMPKIGAVWQRSRYAACEGGSGFAGVRARHGSSQRVATETVPAYDTHYWIVGVRYGWLVAAFALVPAARLTRRLLKGPRRLPGHCPRCNYDLRATPDRCPECGTVPPGA